MLHDVLHGALRWVAVTFDDDGQAAMVKLDDCMADDAFADDALTVASPDDAPPDPPGSLTDDAQRFRAACAWGALLAAAAAEGACLPPVFGCVARLLVREPRCVLRRPESEVTTGVYAVAFDTFVDRVAVVPADVTAVAAEGDVMVWADGRSVHVVRLSVPSDDGCSVSTVPPAAIASIPCAGAVKVALHRHTAYVSCGRSMVLGKFDIRHSAPPEQVKLPPGLREKTLDDIVIAGGKLYAVDNCMEEKYMAVLRLDPVDGSPTDPPGECRSIMSGINISIQKAAMWTSSSRTADAGQATVQTRWFGRAPAGRNDGLTAFLVNSGHRGGSSQFIAVSNRHHTVFANQRNSTGDVPGTGRWLRRNVSMSFASSLALIVCDFAKSMAVSTTAARSAASALSLPSCGTLLRSAIALGDDGAVLVWPMTRSHSDRSSAESTSDVVTPPPRVVPLEYLQRPSFEDALLTALPAWARCYGGGRSFQSPTWHKITFPVSGDCTVSIRSGSLIDRLQAGQVFVGGSGGGLNAPFVIPSDHRVVAIKGRAGDNVDQLQFVIRAFPNDSATTPMSSPVSSQIWGGGGGSPFSIEAPDGYYIVAFHAASDGSYLLSVGAALFDRIHRQA